MASIINNAHRPVAILRRPASKTWILATPTLQARTVVTGLPAGTTVQFRYRGVTKTGVADWSAPVSLLVK